MEKLIINLEKDIRIVKLFDYIFEEVRFSGGDGDCLVICRCYDAIQIGELFYNYVAQIPYFLEKTKDDLSFVVWNNQESWRFSNDLNEQYPNWQQCVIRI